MKDGWHSCRGVSKDSKINSRLDEIAARLNALQEEVDRLIEEARSMGAEIQPIWREEWGEINEEASKET